jgi:hypothetical protein
MLNGAVFVTAGISESVTPTAKFDAPTRIGVPEILPVPLFWLARVSPEGSCPAVMLQAYGGTPPVAFRGPLYPIAVVPFGKLAVVIWRGGGVCMLMESGRGVAGATWWLGNAASCTWTVKQYTPACAGEQDDPVAAAAVGAPLNCPVEELNAIPGGKLFTGDRVQLSGGTPPCATTEALYWALTWPAGSGVVRTESGGGGLIVIWYVWLVGGAAALGLLVLSTMVTLNVVVPEPHGVPEIVAVVLVVDVVIVRQAGRDGWLKEYGGTPPVKAMVTWLEPDEI